MILHRVGAGRARIAVCAGSAFSFAYQENLELLEQAGGELVMFDPIAARGLPEGCGTLYTGGGFPEVFAAALAENRPLPAELCRRARGGLVTWAERGGLMWLAESLDGKTMAGVLERVRVEMQERLTLGYRAGDDSHAVVPRPLGDGPSRPLAPPRRRAAARRRARAVGPLRLGPWRVPRPDPVRLGDIERAALYAIIRARRDVRRFRPDPLDPAPVRRGVAAARRMRDLQLDGIREAPAGIVVCCDRRVAPAGVIGRPASACVPGRESGRSSPPRC